MRTHIQFTSEVFPSVPGEEEEVNCGRFGKQLAEYLRGALIAQGLKVEPIFAEDWGWVVPMLHPEFKLWVGCGNYEEITNGFLCFIEPSKPAIRKWFRKIDTRLAVENLAGCLERSLNQHPGVSNLRWWTESEAGR